MLVKSVKAIYSIVFKRALNFKPRCYSIELICLFLFWHDQWFKSY